MKPFVKWAGGKRQILDKINGYIDEIADGSQDFTYIEPFLGGGAVFFDRKPTKAIINDLNEDLINAYKVIQSNKIEELIIKLQEFDTKYRQDPDDFYYEVRAWDRREDWPQAYSPVERAARMIFLNKTCYNGLYRVNNKGQFNTPIGRYRNPTICDSSNLREIHKYLFENKDTIKILSGSYEAAINMAKAGDIIYVDPPYDYEDDDGFTKYQLAGFTFSDFEKLKIVCDRAIDNGAALVLSNNATEKVIELFSKDSKYQIFYYAEKFSTLRSINSNGNERKSGKEVIILGFNNTLPQANDITKIVNMLIAGQRVLDDKDYALKILDLNTERQISYYLSALVYLGFLTHEKKFTDSALKVIGNKEEIEKEIFNRLISKDIFNKIYNDLREKSITKSTTDDIEMMLLDKKDTLKLSDSTFKRRASTIRSWINWMLGYRDI